MNCEADMAMTPERKVDAALNARSACPILPCWIGFGLFLPDFVNIRPARSLSPATDAGAVEAAFVTAMSLLGACYYENYAGGVSRP